MESFVRRLPKAELHVHIEGTLEPEMLFRLAAKHGVAIPFATVEEVRRAYRFSNLQSFLDIYYAGAAVLRDEEDFYALTRAYLGRAYAEGTVHVEIFFDPQTHTVRGVPLAAVIGGISRALRDGERDFKISHRLILCFLRHLSAADAMLILEQALAHRDAIAAVGLDSSELGHPPSKFVEVFSRARAQGLRAVAHAGEEGPAAYIVEALDLLKVSRIDHGVRCEEDPQLLERLRRERIPLTVCPLSNVKLGVFRDMRSHNLKRLLDLGLCAMINSDDPAYFGGYLLENYLSVQRHLSLSRSDMTMLARHSIEASFLDEAGKRRWLCRIDAMAVANSVDP